MLVLAPRRTLFVLFLKHCMAGLLRSLRFMWRRSVLSSVFISLPSTYGRSLARSISLELHVRSFDFGQLFFFFIFSLLTPNDDVDEGELLKCTNSISPSSFYGENLMMDAGRLTWSLWDVKTEDKRGEGGKSSSRSLHKSIPRSNHFLSSLVGGSVRHTHIWTFEGVPLQRSKFIPMINQNHIK